jgi:hypothetical protein
MLDATVGPGASGTSIVVLGIGKGDMVIPPERDVARKLDSTLSRTKALAVSIFP